MPSRVKARTRTNDPIATRGRILDVAARLFQTQGYHGTAIQDLVAAAGVTTGGLHHHFPSKKAIGLAVIRERAMGAVQEIWLDPLAASISTRAGIYAVFRAVEADLDAAATVRGCILSNLALELSLVDADFRLEIERIFAAWRNAVAAKLRDDQAAGTASVRDIEGFGAFAVAAYSGAMAMAKAAQSSAPLASCRRELIRALAV